MWFCVNGDTCMSDGVVPRSRLLTEVLEIPIFAATSDCNQRSANPGSVLPQRQAVSLPERGQAPAGNRSELTAPIVIVTAAAAQQ